MENSNTFDSLITNAVEIFYPYLKKIEDFDQFVNYIDKRGDTLKTELVSKCIEQFDEEGIIYFESQIYAFVYYIIKMRILS